MAFFGVDIEALMASAAPAAVAEQIEASAATSPPAAEVAGGERAGCPPSAPPAPPDRPFQSQCKRCRQYHHRPGDLCAGCVADDRDINGMHGACWDLRLLLAYTDRMNDVAEGRVYLALIENTIHKALDFARCRLPEVA